MALAEAVLFLLRRARARDPKHRSDPHDSRECECDGCRHVKRIEREMR